MSVERIWGALILVALIAALVATPVLSARRNQPPPRRGNPNEVRLYIIDGHPVPCVVVHRGYSGVAISCDWDYWTS